MIDLHLNYSYIALPALDLIIDYLVWPYMHHQEEYRFGLLGFSLQFDDNIVHTFFYPFYDEDIFLPFSPSP